MIQARYLAGRVVSTSNDAFTLYERSRFGERNTSEIEYTPLETLFLIKQGKLTLHAANHTLSFEAAFQKFKKQDKKLHTKWIVFFNLRQRGYIVKTAFKFGAEFRVYEKGAKPGEDHARWLVCTTQAHDTLKWHELAAKSRVAHTTKKQLLIAIVDEDGDVSYYANAWIKL